MITGVNKRFIYTTLSALAILIGTAIAIQYAKGGFRVTPEGFIQGTGLLAANSFPTAAEILIDDKFITATDDTVYLEPGNYNIKIEKDGYTSWTKNIRIEKELVVQTNATLFPKAPSLNTLTFSGAENLSPSPDGQKIIFYSNSNSSDRKNGLYLLELVNNPLSFQKEAKQITGDSPGFDLESAKFIWSPDSSEVILISDHREVLLDISTMNTLDTLQDISYRKKQILSEWEQEMYLREREFFAKFPAEIISIATESAKNIYISPDKKRMFYTATAELTLPDTLTPTVPVTSSQPEERTLVIGGIYVYDREEDKNFRVGTEKTAESVTVPLAKQLLALDMLDKNSPLLSASPSAFTTLQATESATTANKFNIYHSSLSAHTYQWFPDSKHLLYIEDNNIKIMEYDTTNQTNIYSGPFMGEFIYPWPNGDKLVVLTSFSPDSPNNLYAIELKK
ncbi:PEGA domain-containing protein [Patescibacteria group bacterium]|nr:PEGA domain-containing protein [Patescibacteria group bacterium]